MKDGFIENVYYRFFNVSTPSAYIFAIHGLGGHCLWFDKAAALFNNKGIGFFSFDLPAFGQSKYEKGTISSYKVWVDVSRNLLWKYLNDFAVKKPVFILGHSMGALIALNMVPLVKANGWILSVPGFQGHKDSFPFSSFTLPVLFKSLFCPKSKITVPFGPEILTKNIHTQKELKKDPYRVINPDANIYLQVYLLSNKAKKLCSSLTEPVLMLQADEDRVCSNHYMDKCFKEISSSNKEKIVYGNSYHDLFVEDDLNALVDDISAWIQRVISS
ncbi:MAG: alpha/beta fold hydrolase [Candidatus Melainabacteria bacterium]|nr:alpha/beta fold hydrolase [Candidatus Melainabacteria bacterium]